MKSETGRTWAVSELVWALTLRPGQSAGSVHGCAPTESAQPGWTGGHAHAGLHSSTRQPRPPPSCFLLLSAGQGAGSPQQSHAGQGELPAFPRGGQRPSSVGAVGTEGWHHPFMSSSGTGTVCPFFILILCCVCVFDNNYYIGVCAYVFSNLYYYCI